MASEQSFEERLKAALGDRYSIEGEIGRGGMAIVYLAEDLRHHRKVAVKVLRPELAAGLGPERFLREIQIAARLQHPHILMLIDSGEADGLLFYVMPFVEGESLRAKLEREGELPVSETVRILRDVVDALADAHEHGVVHRDIKPGNVLLRGRHALVTDFGVARAVTEASGQEHLTRSGAAVGTPAYMAPEQAAAHPHIDHRADIYALGVLAYEMLAGRPPFLGASAQVVLAAHLTQEPDPVTKHRETVPSTLASLVMKCLEKRPADRPQSAEELLPQLVAMETPREGISSRGATTPIRAAPAPTTRTPEPTLARSRILVATAARIARRLWVTLVSPIPNRVVVAPFHNHTGDPGLDPLGMMAADWLTQALTESGFVEVVDAQTVRVATGSLPDGDFGEPGAWPRMLASETRAGIIVSGAYYRHGDSLELRSRLTDARRGTLLSGVAPVTGPSECPHQALDALRERVLAAMAEELDARLGSWESGASKAPLYSAYLSYLDGLESYLRWDMEIAATHFERAISIDAGYPRALLMAAQAHHLAGEQQGSLLHLQRASAIAEDLKESRDRLHRYDRAHVDFLVALIRQDHVRAYQATREMMKAAPGSDDACRETAINALRIRRPRECLALLSRLDPERGLMKRWTDEYWSNLCQAHHLLGDHKKELAVARGARRRDPDNVMFMGMEARALAALHRVGEVPELLDRVIERALTAPDVTSFFVHVGGVPHVPAIQVAFRWAGTELRAHGHPEAAASAFERAIAWLESRLEEDSPAPGRRMALGDFLYLAEEWDRAEAAFRELHEQDPTNVAPLGYLGVLAARRGDTELATEISTELTRQDFDPLFTRIPDQQRCWRARIAAVLGRREEAVTLLRPIFHRTTPDGHPLHAHAEMDFESLRDHPPFQALVGPEG